MLPKCPIDLVKIKKLVSVWRDLAKFSRIDNFFAFGNFFLDVNGLILKNIIYSAGHTAPYMSN